MIPKKRKFKTAMIILIVIGGICLLGTVWNFAATQAELSRLSPEGAMVNVFDTKIHIFSIGEATKDQPEILLLSGLNTPSPVADFYPLWSVLQSDHRVSVLERPGYGWSRPTKRDRTVENIVEEYRMALKQTDAKPPYILVAHSISGMEALYFASVYPDEVAGVVLLDCTPPEIIVNYGPDAGKVSLVNRLIAPVRTLGILRLISTVSPGTVAEMSQSMRNNFSMVSDYFSDLDMTFAPVLYYNKMVIREQENRYRNAQNVSDLSFPDNIPVTLIIADLEEYHAYPEYEEQMSALRSWPEKYPGGKAVLLNGSHYIHHYDPEGICLEIRLHYEEE